MTITDQQRKLFWIVAAILVAAYFAPSVITFVSRMTDAQQARYAAPERQAPPPRPVANAARAPQSAGDPALAPGAQPSPAATPAPDAQPPSPDEETALSAPPTLTGNWEGSANTETGICQLKLEIRNAVDMPGIKGYGAISCIQLGPLVSAQAKGNVKSALDVVRRTTPTALMLSGKVRRDGAIRFHVDNIIGPPPQDKACTMTWIKVSQFGTKIAAQWEDGCKGGQAILQRGRP